MPSSSHSYIAEHETMNIAHYVQVIRRYQWRILSLAIALTVLASLFVLSVTPRYTAKASLLIEAEQANVLSIEEIYGLDSSRKEYFQTQYEILRSRKIAQRVVEKLDLTQQPSFNLAVHEQNKSKFIGALKGIKTWLRDSLPFIPRPPKPELNTLQTEQAQLLAQEKFAIDRLVEDLTISPLMNTQMVDISFVSENPNLAAQIANTVAEVYIESYLQAKLEMTAKATSWLNESLQGLRNKLDNAEKELSAFDERERLVNVDGVASLASDELQQLTDQLIDAQVVLQRNQAIFEQVNRQGVSIEELSTVPEVLNHPSINSVKREEVVAQSKVSELKEVYGPKHPILIAANAELSSIQNSLREQIGILVSGITNEYRTTQAKVDALKNDIETAKANVRQLSSLENQRRALQRDVDINQQLYDSFFTRLKETDQLGGFETANARVLDQAFAPKIPSEPRIGLILFLVFFVSIIVGSVLAFTIEALNSGVRSVDDVERQLGQRMLGIIPWQSHKKGQDLPLRHFFDQQNHTFSESIRTLRTSLQLLNIDAPSQTILVASSVPKEGKSTVSINLAFAMGQLNKVLLIDADLRKPSIAKRFDLPGFQPGLSNLIAQTHAISECIVTDKESNIDILTSGSLPPNPQELLASPRFSELVDELRKHYDFIIIDSAPTHAVSDAIVISKLADSLVYVAKADSTNIKVINAGLSRFMQVGHRIDGVVLNQVDLKKAGKTGDYGGYYDKYGYENQQ